MFNTLTDTDNPPTNMHACIAKTTRTFSLILLLLYYKISRGKKKVTCKLLNDTLNRYFEINL